MDDSPRMDRTSAAGGPPQGVYPTSSAWRWPYLLAGLLVGASAAALTVDRALAQWSVHEHAPAALRKMFQLSEPFGHGLGVLGITLLIVLLAPQQSWAAPRILLASLGAGALADVIKLLVSRVRPRHADLTGDSWDVIQSWLPLTGAGSHGQSFPSGHMATAVGFAFALSLLYPRGRWFFVVLAIFVGCQRLDENSHYLSDILFGAAVGAFTAGLCLYQGPVARLFDRREEGWKGSKDQRIKGAK